MATETLQGRKITVLMKDRGNINVEGDEVLTYEDRIVVKSGSKSVGVFERREIVGVLFSDD